VRSVGLVDRDDVGQLKHALLYALELVPGPGQGQQQEGVDHAATETSDCPTPTVSTRTTSYPAASMITLLRGQLVQRVGAAAVHPLPRRGQLTARPLRERLHAHRLEQLMCRARS
jgi:hypothetical protein